MSSEVETLEATVQRQALAKYDVELEKSLRTWISQVLDQPSFLSNSNSFQELLKDGTVLCQLILKFNPETKLRINNSTLPFKQLENISNYLTICETWLASTESSFRSTDLFEAKDMNSVLGNLNTFRTFVQKHGDGLPQYLASRTVAPSTPKTTRVASTPSVNAAPNPSPALPQSSSSPSCSAPSSSSSSSSTSSDSSAKISVTKLEDDVRIKAEFKFNTEHGENILKWIEAVLAITIPDRDFYNALKSGEILCDLLNKVSPKSVPVTHRTSLAFKQMENISNYLKACRDVLDMSDTELFETADLFKKQNLSGVANHLDLFARVAVSLPGAENLPKLQSTQSLSLWSASLSEGFDFMSQTAPEPSTEEEKELVRWVNRQLSGAAHPAIRNLSTELRTGVVLILLLEKFTSSSVGIYEPEPTSLANCIFNASQIIRFVSSQLFGQIDFLQASDIVQARPESLIKFVSWVREKFDLEYAFLSLLGRSTEPPPSTSPPPIVSSSSTSSSTSSSPSSSTSSSPSSSSTLITSPTISVSVPEKPVDTQTKSDSNQSTENRIQETERYLYELSDLVSQLQNRSAELESSINLSQSKLDRLVTTIDSKSSAWAQEEKRMHQLHEENEAKRGAMTLAAQQRQSKLLQELEEKRGQLDAQIDQKQKDLQELESKVVLASMESQAMDEEPPLSPSSTVSPSPSSELPTTKSESTGGAEANAADPPSSSSLESPSSKREKRRSTKSDGKKSSSSHHKSSHKKSSRSSSSAKLHSDRPRASHGDLEQQTGSMRAKFFELYQQAKTSHDAQMDQLRTERAKSAEDFAKERQKMSTELEALRKELQDMHSSFESEKEQQKRWHIEWTNVQEERKRTEESWKLEEETRLKTRAFARVKRVSDLQGSIQHAPPRATVSSPAASPQPAPAAEKETPEVIAAQITIRKRIVEEILSTERSYLSSLEVVEKGLCQALKTVLSPSDFLAFFASLPDLIVLHRKILQQLQALVADWKESSCVSVIFSGLDLSPYFPYVAANPYVPILLRLFRSRYPTFAGVVKTFEAQQKSRLDVESLLIMPVQRLPRYVLLMREMRKYSSLSHNPESCQNLDAAIKVVQTSLDKINGLIDKRVSSTIPVIQNIVDNWEASINLPETLISNNRIILTPPTVLTFKRQEAPSFSGRPKSAIVGSSAKLPSHVVSPKKNTELYALLFDDLIVFGEKIPSETSSSKTHKLILIITLADFISAWSDSKQASNFGIDFCSTRWVFSTTSSEVRGEWLRGLHLLKEKQQNALFALK